MSSPACPHCRSPVPEGCREAPYCCRGCREVAALLKVEGLGRYYDLAQGDVLPAAPPAQARTNAWLEPLIEASEAGDGVCRIELDVQGIHCAACVWLMDEVFKRKEGAAGIRVNPALGKVQIAWEKGRFDVRSYVREIERFGYQFGPSRKGAAPASRDLLIRIGVCGALDMGVMMFAVPFYLGLAPDEPEVFRLFSLLTAVLSGLVVAIGGWPFFRAAWESLRRGVMHLDLPIALGMALAYGVSIYKFRDGRGDQAYFDAVSEFTTLMLIGRWLQERLIERNRRFLLEDGGADALQTRREVGARLEVTRVSEVVAGDVLVVAPGDLVPVDGGLLDTSADVSTDWINGESAPQRLGTGAVVPAGAFNAGRRAMRVRARTGFEQSPLPRLLRAAPAGGELAGRLVDLIARYYVPAVFFLAGLGLWIWWPHGSDRALEVTIALLVVTCPCAIGIAVPLAYELALSRLRRGGVLVRSEDLLARALEVKHVLFDKTGTLTLGRLELAEPGTIAALSVEAQGAAYDLSSRSNHPVSRCLAEELARGHAPFTPDAEVLEVPGRGLELARSGRVWRLGRPGWAAPLEAAGHDVTVLGCDGVLVQAFALRESVRADARQEIGALEAAGYGVWLVSGDGPARVERTAAQLGIAPERTLANQTPEQKAEVVHRVGAAHALFVGDGVNDTLAFAAARATATPAIDRPVMPGRADFFLLGESIAGIRTLLDAARRLRAVEFQLLFWGLAYNAWAVWACLAGHMTPLRAAVAMPLSSLALIALASVALGRRSAAARPATPATIPATPEVAT